MRRVALAALCALLVVPASAAAKGGRPAAELLPDLDMQAPSDLVVRSALRAGGTRFRLGFTSAVDNVGVGALVIQAQRENVRKPRMTASQKVLLENGRWRTYRGVGIVRFVESETHGHWHFLPFARYELRRAADFSLVVRDRKTGFCLSDHHESDPYLDLWREPARPVFTGWCAPGDRDRLRIKEGASVGYRDIYPGHLEGQYLDVTGVPAGRYVLVHRVNAARRLRESDYANNAASLLVRLAWPHGRGSAPTVQVLRVCEYGAECGRPRSGMLSAP